MFQLFNIKPKMPIEVSTFSILITIDNNNNNLRYKTSEKVP